MARRESDDPAASGAKIRIPGDDKRTGMLFD
jgi:hypothetical protein